MTSGGKGRLWGPSGCSHSTLCCPGFAASVRELIALGRASPKALPSSFMRGQPPRDQGGQKTHTAGRKLFLIQCFWQAEVSWAWGKEEGRVRGCEPCQSKAWTQHPPRKGNFPLRPGSSPRVSGSLASAREHRESWQGPAHPLGRRNWQGPERGLMKYTCFTQEGSEAKGGVVAFQRDPVSQWQSCEKNPSSPSRSAETFPGNDIHRPKVNQTRGQRLPVNVI